MSLRVLYEDRQLLVVAKPAGRLVQADRPGGPSLLADAKAYRKKTEAKRGNVYLGLVHRLDRPVSGIVLFAKTSKAARRLSEQFRQRSVQKIYLAVTEFPAREKKAELAGLWEDVLVKNAGSNEVRIATASESRGRPARTRWRRRASAGRLALFELEPFTGRSHQLRVQSAARGYAIVGDRKYGSRHPLAGAIALHAWRLKFHHPITGEPVEVSCPPPAEWKEFPFDWRGYR